MAKKHKHEEHVNHERWLVSFADMMTLLFALFVVLYALGVQDLEKLKALSKSIQFAFHIQGEGKTQDTGIFEKQTGGGETTLPAPLITAQDGAMREFLKEVLPEYEEVAGKSLEIVQTDDTVSMTAPLSDFFPAGRPYPIKNDVQGWFDKAISASLAFTSTIRVVVQFPDVIIGQSPAGEVLTSQDLCIERLKAIERVIKTNPRVRTGMVAFEWSKQKLEPGQLEADWEHQARISIAFSNTRAGNR